MKEQISGSAPSFIVLQPALDEDVGLQSIGLAARQSDAMTGVSSRRRAVPAAMFGNEQLILILGRELAAPSKGDAQGRNVRAKF